MLKRGISFVMVTSRDPHDPHHPEDRWIDGQKGLRLEFLEDDADDGEEDDDDVELVPLVVEVSLESQGGHLHRRLQDKDGREEVIEDTEGSR